MKNNFLLKNESAKGFLILFTFITLVNNIVVFSHNSNYLNVEENNYSKVNNQAINLLQETNSTKVHFKLLAESYSSKFYSYEYFIKKLDNHHKILRIISETVSESNLRNSTFLIAELTTSTQILSNTSFVIPFINISKFERNILMDSAEKSDKTTTFLFYFFIGQVALGMLGVVGYIIYMFIAG